MGGAELATAAKPVAPALRHLAFRPLGWRQRNAGKTTVKVHAYLDGRLAVLWGAHRLADYDAKGTLVVPEQQAA